MGKHHAGNELAPAPMPRRSGSRPGERKRAEGSETAPKASMRKKRMLPVISITAPASRARAQRLQTAGLGASLNRNPRSFAKCRLNLSNTT